MNPTTRLRRRRDQLVRTVRAARKALDEIRAYVLSDKFHEWPYVNVQDIVLRCANGQSEIDFAENLCAMCGMAEQVTDLICADCAAAIEYRKAHDEREKAA